MQATAQAPKAMEASGRRSEIIRAATLLFLERGFAGTSMAMLARAAGIQKATFYHHFPNKEALFVACVSEGFDARTEELKRIRDDASLGPLDKLSAAIDEIQSTLVFSEVGRMSPIIAEVATSLPSVGEQFYAGFIQRQHEVVDAILDEGVAAGVFRDQGRDGLRYLIFGPVVTLSLSCQMLAASERRDQLLNVQRVCAEHKAAIIDLCRTRDEAL